MSSILEFWTKQIPKKKRKKENNKKNTVMFTSEGRDGLTQVFVLLVLLFFPLYGNVNERQKKRKAREIGHVLRKNYEACDNTHAYFSYYCYRFSPLRMVLCLS